MNIFILDTDPKIFAQLLCDKHAGGKMYVKSVYNNFVVITENHLSNEETLNEYFYLGS